MKVIANQIKMKTNNPPISNTQENLALEGVAIGFIDSFIIGLSYYSAFILQKLLFDFQSRQFLIGQKELIQMSAGIAFCYAFIFVLRKGYLKSGYTALSKAIKQSSRFTAECYVLYLAMLFLVKDINFTSARLAIGVGFIISLVLISLVRLCYQQVFKTSNNQANLRKITFKGFKGSERVEKTVDFQLTHSNENLGNKRDIFKIDSPGDAFTIRFPEDIARLKDTANVSELFVEAENLSIDNVLKVVEMAGDRKIKVVITQPSKNEPSLSEV